MVLKTVIDTNRYVDYCKGEKETLETVRRANTIFITFITLAELRAGFVSGTRALENEKTLTEFLNNERVEILYADEQSTRIYARVFAQLKKQGTPIPTNDIWIAALTMQHNLSLLTRDEHFDHLPQISKI